MSTLPSAWSRALNFVPADKCEAAAASYWRFHSALLFHIAVPRYLAAIFSPVLNMFNFWYQGWRPGPLMSTRMVSSKFRCIKCIRRLVQLAALPGHPSTGKCMAAGIHRKATPYYFGIRRDN